MKATALALSGLDQSVRDGFVAAPLDVIRDDLGLTVKPVDHLTDRRNDGGACDGVSFLQDGSSFTHPRIQVSVKTSLSHTNWHTGSWLRPAEWCTSRA